MSLVEYQYDVPRTISNTVLELPFNRLEHRLGRFHAEPLAAATNLADLGAAVDAMRGGEPFSTYATYDHGVLSTLVG